MKVTVLGYTIGVPQAVLAGLSLIFILALVTAGVTATAPFAAFNSDWTGASDLRKLADEDGRTTFVSNGAIPAEASPNETVVLLLGVAEPDNETQQSIGQFVNQGGTVIVTADTGFHSNTLLGTVGATARIQNGPLRDPRNYHRSPLLPIAESTENTNSPNVSQFTLNHAGIVSPNDATVMAQTSEFAYVDTNQNGQFDSSESLSRRPVMTTEQVGDGRVLTISDSSVFVNGMMERDGNKALAETLLAGHEQVVLMNHHSGSVPPIMHAIITLRRNPGLQLMTLFALLSTLVVSRHYFERENHERSPATTNPESLESSAAIPTEMSSRVEGFVRLLGREHPDWNRQRLKRVVRAVINSKDSDNE